MPLLLLTTLLAFASISVSVSVSASASPTCKPPTQAQTPCPPFPYPFSTLQNCAHPSFHLTCHLTTTSSLSLLVINNLTFSLLNYDPTSSTLTLSPHPSPPQPQQKSPKCPSNFPYIPKIPLNFTNTPFTLSSSSCSRLSLLKPCPNPTLSLPNCSLCPWDCTLVKHPFRLVETVCETGGASNGISEQGCQSDVLGYLNNVLKLGFDVEFDPNNDDYFSLCRKCKSSNTSSFEWIRHHKERVKLVSLGLFIVCLLSLFVLVYIVVQSRRIRIRRLAEDLEDPTTTFLYRHRCAALLPPVFTYDELEASTNRFDPKRKIGDGGFGSVFLGKLNDGRVVAVKYLHRNHQTAVGVGGITVSSKSFCNEILILSSIEHPNLVKLHGYCSDPRGLLLVYDYISNGTLADHLHGPKKKVSGSLGWQTRVDIALQVAIAVEYLHFTVEPPVVHRDITTCNIFVDESMRVRVGDFGLSRLLVYSEYRNSSGELSGSSSGCIWTGPQGTPGYLDPDYHKSFRLTEKSDVYSFGVVLLELITGLKAVDQKREKREMALVDMVVAKIQLGLLDQVVDPALAAEGTVVEESVAAVAELAFQCLAADKDDRPDAKEVVAELRRVWSRTRGVRGSNANVVVVPAGDETIT
ncbi:LEAF RUST 10 DISEASE-RESISTANCE LOCUS RECEPTOR-LIKE PROTEIN KINASE-like 1.5 [Silene latifolia]|uniref:LEAF RUST 10 DISEASE-RESISTANCE LOCUS RECEPTOR-LIKE PROTEIN KINASE-like 1.5 n=1 Tax=Silene latifolia TaxID=37657 RepID=UPI003D78A8A2